MRMLFAGVTCLTVSLCSSLAPAQDRQEKNDADRSPQAERQQSGEQQTAQRQSIRGRVAGVTTVGEAVIDPVTNTAVIVQANYLTVLGSPARGQAERRRQADADSGAREDDRARSESQQRDSDRRGDAEASGGRRENLYLVAISPETTVRQGRGGRQDDRDRRSGQSGEESNGQRSDDRQGDQAQSQQGQSQREFERLEIGDRVEVEFMQTGRVRQQASGQTGQAGRQSNEQKDSTQDAKRRHGRSRIYVGEADSLTILSEEMSQRGQQSQEGSQRDDRQDRDR